MAESNPPQKTPIDYISDSESSDEELNQHLHTFQEERYYDTIKESAQATQAALSYMSCISNTACFSVNCAPLSLQFGQNEEPKGSNGSHPSECGN